MIKLSMIFYIMFTFKFIEQWGFFFFNLNCHFRYFVDFFYWLVYLSFWSRYLFQSYIDWLCLGKPFNSQPMHRFWEHYVEILDIYICNFFFLSLLKISSLISGLFFFKALSKYNSHAIKFGCFNYTNQWFLVNFQSCAADRGRRQTKVSTDREGSLENHWSTQPTSVYTRCFLQIREPAQGAFLGTPAVDWRSPCTGGTGWSHQEFAPYTGEDPGLFSSRAGALVFSLWGGNLLAGPPFFADSFPFA